MPRWMGLATFAAQMFFMACAAWLAAIVLSGVLRGNRIWPYSVRGLFLFVTVAVLTMAMAAALMRASN
ncbi:MAG: hypothetical protein WD738_12435 [Pirellulales bacterium]